MHLEINMLLLIGIAVFMGLSGGKIFQKLKIPQVVGYIIIGVALGDSFFGLLKHDIIEILTPLTSFALGLIGFMIGGELKKDIFKKYGKKFVIILLWQGLLTFFLVAGAVMLFTGELQLAILLGALASATAPAATVDVLWEYKSKGVLTTTILAVVALDDGLALILYGFSSAFAKTLVTGEAFSFMSGFVAPVKEISGALVLGAIVGYILYRILLKIQDKEQLLVLSIGAILVNTGLAGIFEFDLILSNMAMGVLLANKSSRIGKMTFDTVKSFTPPIYVLFFVLVGARLQIGLLPKMGILGLIYLITRMIGKVAGSFLGAYFSKAETVVRRYLGISMFSQAGVAIGLAIAIYQSFSKLGPAGQELGMLILNVITATTFIVQLIGPSCVKVAIEKAGEVGKDITEEDILNSYRVEQVMEKKVETIKASEKLSTVAKILRNSSHVYFPVVDYNNNDEFSGVISFQDIKDVMFEKDLGDLVLAGEVAVYDVLTSYKSEPLKSAVDKFMFVNLNYLPIVESEKSHKFAGILHKRRVNNILKEEIIGKLVESKRSVDAGKGIKIHKMLDVNTIKLEIEAKNKKDVICEMANLIAQSGKVEDIQGLINLLLERESQTTTGIGHGIAIPHVRTDKVSNVIIGFGRSNKGVDFLSIDRKPVHFIFMFVTPLENWANMVRVMGEISKLLRDDELRNLLKTVESPEAVIELIKEREV